MPSVKNHPAALKYILSILLGLPAALLVYGYLVSDYDGFTGGLLKSVQPYSDIRPALADPRLIGTYETMKPVLTIALILLLGFLYDACFRVQGRPARFMDRLITGVATLLDANLVFWRQLSPVIRWGLLMAGAAQVIFYLFFLLNIPFHYDEAWAYNHLTGKGFAAAAFYYPESGNQLLYNMAAWLFNLLPFPARVTTRLPSFIASLFAAWYFFKLVFRHFKPELALFLTILFAGSLPVVLYGIEARGYSFLTLSTVLLLYSADRIAVAGPPWKYQVLFLLATIAGLYTMPSSMLLIAPLDIGILCYLSARGQWKTLRRFIAGLEAAAIIVLILYSPVIALNDPGALAGRTDSDQQSVTQLIHRLGPAFRTVWYYLLGTSAMPFFLILPLLAATAVNAWKSRKQNQMLSWLILVLLLSPPFLFLSWPNRPFTGTWTFLIVPLTLSFGYLCAYLANIPRFIPQVRRLSFPPALLLGCYGCVFVLLFVNFKLEHNWRFAVDYHIRNDLGKIGSNIDRVRTIGISGGPWEFYVAEAMYFESFERNPGRNIRIGAQQGSGDEDMLILMPDSTGRQDRTGYQVVGRHPAFYSLYLRTITDTASSP